MSGFTGNDGSALIGGLNPSGVAQAGIVDAQGRWILSPTATTGTLGSPAPTSATLIAGIDGSGNLEEFLVDGAGLLQTSLWSGANNWTIDSGGNGHVILLGTGNLVGAVPQTSGGVSDFHLVSAASNNATTIKASGGQVYGWDISNTNAAWRYVKLYNKATAPAPAADTALLVRTIGVPPGGKATLHLTNGLAGFGNGIAIAAVTGIADNDNTSVGASDLVIDIDWH